MFYFLHGFLKHVESLLTFKVRRSQREIQISGLARETTSSASRPSSLRPAASASEACVAPVGWARAPRRSPAQPSSLYCGLIWPPSWNVRAVPLTRREGRLTGVVRRFQLAAQILLTSGAEWGQAGPCARRIQAPAWCDLPLPSGITSGSFSGLGFPRAVLPCGMG